MSQSPTQIRIIEAAIPLFARKGFEGVSVENIVKAAGINKATLYYHYKGKKELFEAVLHHEFSQLIDRLLRSIECIDDPVEQLRSYIEVMLERKRVLVELMSREILGGAQNIPKDAFDLMHRLAGILVEIIRKGRERGIFREIDPFMILNVLVGATNNYIISAPLREKFLQSRDPETFPCPKFDRQTYVDTLHRMVLSVLEYRS